MERTAIQVEAMTALDLEPGELLQAGRLWEWVRFLPDGAHITPIINRSAPNPDQFVGLRAEWSEPKTAKRRVASDD